MRKLLLMLSLVVLGVNACDDETTTLTPPVGSDDDEYAVYSALIDSLYIYENTAMIVMRDSTEAYDLSDSTARKYLRDGLKIGDTLIDAYVLKNGPMAVLRRAFTIPTDYVLLADSSYQRIVYSAGGWDAFYTQFPGAQGYMTLSRVGFSADGNTALVYASNTPGFLAGSGICATLKKRSGVWKVTGYIIVWVS